MVSIRFWDKMKFVHLFMFVVTSELNENCSQVFQIQKTVAPKGSLLEFGPTENHGLQLALGQSKQWFGEF